MKLSNFSEHKDIIQAILDGKQIQHRIKNQTEPEPTKSYTLPLSELDALEITRDMWKWLGEDISRRKKQWIEQFHPELKNKLWQDCACCQFADGGSAIDCNKCPLKGKWGKSKNLSCNMIGNHYEVWINVYRCSQSERLAAALAISKAAEERIAELTTKPKEPKLRPWLAEEVPVGALIRHTPPISKFRSIIIAVFGDVIATASRSELICEEPDIYLTKYEHSLDHGKTWHPCGVPIE